MEPLISIITVTYNSVNTLDYTIRSLRNQSFRNFEYIVVDGASTDGTLSVIEKNDDIISRWISEPDKGIYDAINKGIAMANGKYVGLIHADDILASNDTLQIIADTLIAKQPDAIYGNLDYVAANDINRVIRRWISNDFTPSLLKKGWMPAHPTLYIERTWFQKLGKYNKTMKISADYDFILRLFSQPGIKTVFINHCIVKMRVGGASNRSLKNIMVKMKEDYQSIKRNGIGGISTLIVKNTSKIHQFFKKNR